MPKSIASVSRFILFGLLAACSSTPLVPEGAPGKLHLAISSNRQLDTESCGCSAQDLGGVEREWHLLAEKKAQHPDLISFVAGTTFVPFELGHDPKRLDGYRRRAEVVHKMLEAMGTTALSPSALDLRLGRGFIAELAASSHFPFVSANLVDPDSGKPIFARYWKATRNTIPIFVTGLASPTHREGLPGDVTISDPVAAMESVLAESGTKDSLVILLSGLTREEHERILEKFPQVAIVLGSGSYAHTVGSESALRNRIFLNPMSRGREVGFLDLDVKLPFQGFYNQEMADFAIEREAELFRRQGALKKQKLTAKNRQELAEIARGIGELGWVPKARAEGTSEFSGQAVTVHGRFRKGPSPVTALAQKARSMP